MNIWNQVPFLRLLLPFLAGILTAIYTELQFEGIGYMITALFLLFGILTFFSPFHSIYKYSWITGILITIFLFIGGIKITILNTEKFSTTHFSKFKNNIHLYHVMAISSPLEKENSYKISLTVTAIKKDNHWITTSGKSIAYFEKDSISKNIRYGDCMILNAKFTEIKPPQNPSEFNYKAFLAHQNIYHQSYIPSKKWMQTGINEGNTIIRSAVAAREYLLHIYKENKITGNEYAVGTALVLGYTDMLDQELISAYAGSGALHVLSVSGLHVGIIYLVFNYLLFFLEKFKYGGTFKMIILLIILWCYATLTGLSPSVLRSATMFSFIVIAQTWKYHTNIFNTLATSCFGLLLYNPFLITEVGFQLSYLAVLGIVAIQPWIYEKWKSASWIINQAWLITSVSIAAQLATFPLGLLYFHQFPNYFILSNLLVIPLSTLILTYGLLMFMLGEIPIIGIAAGKIFSGLVWLLNQSVHYVEKAPGALTQGISISSQETWIIYAVIIFTLVFIYKKQIRYLVLSLTSMIILLSMQSVEAHFMHKQKKLIIYNIPKMSAYDFIDGNHTLLLADSSLLYNERRLLFHILPNWWEKNITDQKLLKIEKSADFNNNNIRITNNFAQFYGKRIGFVNRVQHKDLPYGQQIHLDLLIISKNSNVKINDLRKKYNFKKIIFDSSNAPHRISKWKKECEEMQIQFYSVPDSGAYIAEI